MPTARKTKSGKYRVQVLDFVDSQGKHHNKSFTAPTKKEAELLATQFKISQKATERVKISVGQAVLEYIEAKSNVISPSTLRSYDAIRRKLEEDFPRFMGLRCDNVTENQMQKIISEVALTRSPKTTKNYKTLLCSSYADFKDFRIVLPQSIKQEVEIPTEAQIKALINKYKGQEIEIPILLGAFCMMRRSEICALTMQDINFKKNTITINKAMVLDKNNEWIVKQPKTYSSTRTISVPKFVLERIEQNGKVFPASPNALTERFKRAVRSLGWDFKFHALRHFCLSSFITQGVPLAYATNYGGWEKTSTTPIKIYNHIMKDKEAEIYGRITDYFSQNFSKK